MKLYVYIVSFEIHKNCQIKDFVYHCIAQNAKEACKTARYFWRGDSHQFHVHAMKSRQQDPDRIHVQNWKGQIFDGLDALDKYICLDFKTWRYKSGNQYVYPLMEEA